MATVDSAAQRAQLWQAYATQRDATTRNKLAAEYAMLVKHVVGRILVTLPQGMEQDDLMSYGFLGLLQAIEKYDALRGIKFETFAAPRIRGAVLDELRAQDPLPRTLRQKAKNVERTIHRLEGELGRAPVEQEIADGMGVAPEDLRQILADSNRLMLSLDYMLNPDDGEGGGITLEATVATPETKSPVNQLESRDLRGALIKAIEALPPRERLLISLYYHEGLTMKEIGKVLEVTEARVCQLHGQAVMRMRTKLREYA
jgi:RNA polymerase sigma factor for flagellar operon FliA